MCTREPAYSVSLPTLRRGSFKLSLEDVPADFGSLTLRTAAKSSSSSFLIASFDDMEIQFLVRQRASKSDFNCATHFSAKGPGMDMDEVLECHPVGVCSQMSSVRMRHCEKKLPLVYLSIETERHERASSTSSSIKGDGSDAYMFT
ncbi:hypothetical protein PsorP6_011177 [Peronosclerospora sorghi]|uniref:Uncharacterized protein n=1 Tax=Peronosclerospora sorghi TaxID=230839 RepID=A0ACC0VX23_9STRA|nr:hypothetical protein PsorP6_011177 [Peronosclerospora sorghi]